MRGWEKVSEETFSLDKFQKTMEDLVKMDWGPDWQIISLEDWKRLVREGVIK